MAKGLYRFYWDCGRQGSLEGVFVEDSENIKNVIGKEVYFGEVLGKHSEVYGTLEAKDFTLLTEDKIAVDIVGQYGLGSGYNPFEYLSDETPEDE